MSFCPMDIKSTKEDLSASDLLALNIFLFFSFAPSNGGISCNSMKKKLASMNGGCLNSK